MISIIALICLAFLALVFIVMTTEGPSGNAVEGAGVMKALLLIMVAIPFGVILAGIIG